ncbi:hypothetical protein BT63DRAFT_424453 [Microthyrium microscopicum]|uniref:Uncharacterized protein n=1 Tax=Microthyrium microscopicum TaxID=703497 RepID=A0A6A6UED0_9PEZI|nr:hypothetical protein BT63DRAFT_424453 [Microthyrium microscopicum]
MSDLSCLSERQKITEAVHILVNLCGHDKSLQSSVINATLALNGRTKEELDAHFTSARYFIPKTPDCRVATISPTEPADSFLHIVTEPSTPAKSPSSTFTGSTYHVSESGAERSTVERGTKRKHPHEFLSPVTLSTDVKRRENKAGQPSYYQCPFCHMGFEKRGQKYFRTHLRDEIKYRKRYLFAQYGIINVLPQAQDIKQLGCGLCIQSQPIQSPEELLDHIANQHSTCTASSYSNLSSVPLIGLWDVSLCIHNMLAQGPTRNFYAHFLTSCERYIWPINREILGVLRDLQILNYDANEGFNFVGHVVSKASHFVMTQFSELGISDLPVSSGQTVFDRNSQPSTGYSLDGPFRTKMNYRPNDRRENHLHEHSGIATGRTALIKPPNWPDHGFASLKNRPNMPAPTYHGNNSNSAVLVQIASHYRQRASRSSPSSNFAPSVGSIIIETSDLGPESVDNESARGLRLREPDYPYWGTSEIEHPRTEYGRYLCEQARSQSLLHCGGRFGSLNFDEDDEINRIDDDSRSADEDSEEDDDCALSYLPSPQPFDNHRFCHRLYEEDERERVARHSSTPMQHFILSNAKAQPWTGHFANLQF